MASFRYPSNLSEQHPVHCRISIHKRLNRMADVIAQGLDVSNVDIDAFTSVLGKGVEKGKQLLDRALINESSKSEHQIYLYAPSAINFADGLAYDNAEMTAVVSALTSTADEVANTTGGSKVAAVTEGIGKAVGAQLASNIRKGGIGQQAQLKLGIARNPRLELLFRAPTLRQLSLTWKFMPSNQQESGVVEALIKTIRAHAHPELSKSGYQFSFPDVFKIDFITKSGGKAKMIQFNQAYCTAVSVNYGSSGPAFFSDGAPAEIDFTISLQEARVITRKDITGAEESSYAGIKANGSGGPPGAVGDGFGGGD